MNTTKQQNQSRMGHYLNSRPMKVMVKEFILLEDVENQIWLVKTEL